MLEGIVFFFGRTLLSMAGAEGALEIPFTHAATIVTAVGLH